MATTLENYFENWRSRAQNSAAAQFFRWWGAELKALLPPELQARMLHASRRVVMRIGGGELALSAQEGGTLQVLDVFPLDQDPRLQHQQLRKLLVEHELHEVPRDLLLPADVVLRKELVLPIAAESNLRQALGFEMDRQTPFRANEVYFDYRVLARDRENGQIRLELVLCPRAAVDTLLGMLAPRGMTPSSADMEVDGLPAGLNLLPPELRYRFVNRRSRINILLGLAGATLLALVMAQSLWLREHQVEQLEDAISEVQVEARRVQGIRSQIEDASEAAGFMLKQRNAFQPTVKVMAEVTRVLPDDTFLDRLRVWEGSVQMQGKSDNAQRLIGIINESPMFENASFRGSTRRDSRSGKEIFDLNSSLEPAGGR